MLHEFNVILQMTVYGVESTKLIIYDHNWDDLSYASSVLDPTDSDNSDVPAFVDGVAFHCYAGTSVFDNPGKLAAQFPSKEIHFTECSG